MELEEGASIAVLKEKVGKLQGVQPEQLRVIFAGRELLSDGTLQVRSSFSHFTRPCLFDCAVWCVWLSV